VATSSPTCSVGLPVATSSAKVGAACANARAATDAVKHCREGSILRMVSLPKCRKAARDRVGRTPRHMTLGRHFVTNSPNEGFASLAAAAPTSELRADTSDRASAQGHKPIEGPSELRHKRRPLGDTDRTHLLQFVAPPDPGLSRKRARRPW